jgi:arylsulfatase A-like enzyme
MTGQYAWRKKGTGILPGIAALCIAQERWANCLPNILRRAGYATAAVGKWHLGLGAVSPTDYNKDITPGPKDIGFDYSFIIPATGDRVPCVFVENGKVVGYDPKDPIKLDYSIQRGEPKSFVNGIPRIGGMTGGKAALWKDEDIASTLEKQAVRFIEANKNKPFFLYLATHDIHVPRVPSPKFRGTSQAGVRGDVVQEFDNTVGVILDTLARLKLDENTLVIVTSDNGGVLDPNGPDTVNAGTEATNNGHLHNGRLRGNKGNAYEGGHRVPFIIRWPGRTPAGGTSNELIGHLDCLSTFARITGQKLSKDAGPDSFDMLPAFLQAKPERPCRDHLVYHGNALAIRQGPWVLLPVPTKKDKKSVPNELYNLDDDLSQTRNVSMQHPDRVRDMTALLNKIRDDGRSRPQVPP